MINKCNCTHEGQDKIHGKSRRVFNKCVSKGNNDKFRCTVCGKEVIK